VQSIRTQRLLSSYIRGRYRLLYTLAIRQRRSRLGGAKAKHTAAGIPTWSPTVVLICRSTAYVWQSGRDAQFSADCGRMCIIRFQN
ncbi:hypothetical protein M438DRAFT_134327, partial [Aureobasidium pullulans EXF-150]